MISVIASANAPDAPASGGPAWFDEGGMPLPSFVRRAGDGLHVDLSAMDSPDLFQDFVARVFDSGMRFVELDYALFLKLLFEYTTVDIADLVDRRAEAGLAPELRLAADIVSFPAAREALYRGFRPIEDGGSAEYLFEPLLVERDVTVPRYGEIDATGDAPLLGYDSLTITERAWLDFDEFVAAAWRKGLRYGIDAAAVRAAIDAERTEHLTIARQTPPRQGCDATLEERTDALHRNDAPCIRHDGRVDLSQFRNRFPQVAAGAVLFRKVPRVAGVSGWNVSGRELPPDAVKDFQIQTLAGPGTQVERDEDGFEIVRAVMDGFLNLDAQSGQVSITEKIVNREGVSIRTTGNLALAGDDYEEHGEVQEKRIVEGHNMTFFADVFGNLESDGGCIVVKQTIAGAAARSPGGRIVVEGAASRTLLDARRGDIEVAQAEGSFLMAERVRIGRAVACEIVADEVVIDVAEGCAIAARRVDIATTTVRKQEGTIITLLLPDLARHAAEREQAVAAATAADLAVAPMRAGIEALTAQADMKSYLAIAPRLRSGALKMTPAQEANWQKLLDRVAPTLREYSRLRGQLQAQQAKAAAAAAHLAELDARHMQVLEAVSCRIADVAGDTIVRHCQVTADTPALIGLPAKEVRSRLRAAGTADERIFSGESGTVDWSPLQAGIAQCPAQELGAPA